MRHREADSKIAVDLPGGEEFEPYREELLFAHHIEGALYEVLSVPLVVDDLHLHDIVRCEASVGLPRMSGVVTRSGFGTLRMAPESSVPREALDTLISRLRDAGCLIERGLGVIGAAIPPEADRERIIAILDGDNERGEIAYEAQW